jgi:hypothetical protein
VKFTGELAWILPAAGLRTSTAGSIGAPPSSRRCALIAEISGGAIAVSAGVGAVTLFIGLIDRRRQSRKDAIESRKDAIRKWQRTAIQEIFQKSSTPLLFDDIATRYRSEAVAYKDYDLTGTDLSRQELRFVLIDMIKDDIIGQSNGDMYALAQHGPLPASTDVKHLFDSFMYMMGSYAKRESERDVEKLVLQFVYDDPHKFSLPELAGKVVQSTNMEFDGARSLITRFITERRVLVDKAGKLYLYSEDFQKKDPTPASTN